MKQLIFIIFIALGLGSCYYISNPIKITSIEDSNDDGTCVYTTNLGFPIKMKFIDPCGNHHVGDTIYLTKNKL